MYTYVLSVETFTHIYIHTHIFLLFVSPTLFSLPYLSVPPSSDPFLKFRFFVCLFA